MHEPELFLVFFKLFATLCKTIGNAPLDADKFLIDKIISKLKLDNCELYFVGTSDGGYHNLKLSQQFPQTVKFLGINSSYNTVEDFIDRISSLSHVKKTLVYGSRDVDFDCIVPRLKELEGDNLELIILDGVEYD
jgi:hypothetical protein